MRESNTSRWLLELPLPTQLFLKGFGLGALLGTLVAVVNLVSYLRSVDSVRGEILEVGAIWTVVLGFPLSLFLGPSAAPLMLPWAWTVLLPGLNLGLLLLSAGLLYRVIFGVAGCIKG